MYSKLDESIKENEMFSKKWSKIAGELFLKWFQIKLKMKEK